MRVWGLGASSLGFRAQGPGICGKGYLGVAVFGSDVERRLEAPVHSLNVRPEPNEEEE